MSPLLRGLATGRGDPHGCSGSTLRVVNRRSEVDPSRLPTHVACVMDGNGRWAQARGLPRTKGHTAGEEALIDTVEGAAEIGLRWLTVYAFSTENWRRPPSEVRFLMGFNESLLVRRSHELHDQNVRIRFVGRPTRVFPAVFETASTRRYTSRRRTPA